MPAAAGQPANQKSLYDIALVLMRTYNVERLRFENARLASGHKLNDRAFARDFGEIPSERRVKVSDNIEDNPPGKPKQHGQVVTTWLAVAKVVSDHGFDPEKFIRHYFVVQLPDVPTPRPQSFLSAAAVESYTKGRQVSRQNVRIAFGSQVQTFTTAVNYRHLSDTIKYTAAEAWTAVLTDDYLALSAFFRCIMAWHLIRDSQVTDPSPFRQIVQSYLVEAAIQYLVDEEAYDEVWAKWIPPGWKKTADRAYRTYYQLDDNKQKTGAVRG